MWGWRWRVGGGLGLGGLSKGCINKNITKYSRRHLSKFSVRLRRPSPRRLFPFPRGGGGGLLIPSTGQVVMTLLFFFFLKESTRWDICSSLHVMCVYVCVVWVPWCVLYACRNYRRTSTTGRRAPT